MPSPVRSSVRALREDAGWSQTRLAGLVGLTRQSLAAIEHGDAIPSTEVALRLARAFGVPVESIFHLEDAARPIELVESAGIGGSLPGRVRIATVGGRRVAYSLDLSSTSGTPTADGLGEPDESGRVRLSAFADRPSPPDLVVAGCDPAFGLVQDRLQREHGLEVIWLRVGSRAALEALARGVVHVAGLHLEDPESGAYNGPWIERLTPFPTTRFGFATWQQSILLARGNPLGVRDMADLARPDLRFVNREPGSGSRALVERALAGCGVDGAAIPGYLDTSADGHETVARAIASGAAHAGVAIQAVGHALDLATIPLAEEPYELVVPNHFLELPAVDALLGVLRRPAVREQVEALTGYDASAMGRTV